ncbi:methyltransferase-like protein 25B isoform X1 [Clytia hemisphaerica]|uniref:Methyltransferase domain-containing protein n=1 Tax=Clytia hemisphaerica TaxID=252671 RepID=A0A7M5UR94_9CNID|eukprot:TCONS_00015827-protein
MADLEGLNSRVSSFRLQENVLVYNQMKVCLTQAFMFLNEYQWIANSYVAEFFTQDLWSRLPEAWRKCFEEATLDDIANNILLSSAHKSYKSVWPLSLLSFIATCHGLSLNRQQKEEFKNPTKLPKEIADVFKKHIKPKKRHELAILPDLVNHVCERTKVKNVVDVGSGLGHMARVLAYKYGCNVTAVERTEEQLPIARQYDLQIEKELRRFREKGSFLDKEGKVRHVAKEIHLNMTSGEFSFLIGQENNEMKDNSTYNNTTLKNRMLNGGGDTVKDEKDSLIDQKLKNNESHQQSHMIDLENKQTVSADLIGLENNSNQCTLIGLHTCGDLASTMLKVFKKTEHVKNIISVSCCYFRMTLKSEIKKEVNEDNPLHTKTENSDILVKDRLCFDSFSLKTLHSNYKYLENEIHPNGDNHMKVFNGNTTVEQSSEFYGFPMSDFIRKIPVQPLKYKSFETACHFLGDYADKLLGNSPNIKLHCYRAIMEVFIRHVDPSLVLAAIRCKKIKNASAMSFEEYAAKVFERLKLPFHESQLEEINYKEMLKQTKNVTVIHSLALLLGPLIESIALMDKYMFLVESGFETELIPIFDPKISPRNFAVIATRN